MSTQYMESASARERINVAFPREMFDRAHALAAPAGNTASGWIRQVVLDAVERAEADRAALRPNGTTASRGASVQKQPA